MKTGIVKAGPAITGNLIPNPALDGADPGQFPEGWGWQIHPTPQARAGLAIEDGRRILRIDAAFNAEKKRDNYPIIATRDLELKPGASYHLHARLRTDREQGKAGLQAQFFLPAKDGAPAHFWGSSPAEARVGRQWQDFDFAFRIPSAGERGWHEKMRLFRVRLDWPEREGALFAEQISLEETAPLDEWHSWQQSGADQHSIIADPKFLAPEKDDFRLAADSPAWALGFQPIPVEKIGPYASDDRATWPIVESPGARERMAPVEGEDSAKVQRRSWRRSGGGLAEVWRRSGGGPAEVRRRQAEAGGSGGDAYAVQSTPDPMTDTSWSMAETVVGTRVTVNGATRGQKRWYRAAAVNRLGLGPWSEPVPRPLI